MTQTRIPINPDPGRVPKFKMLIKPDDDSRIYVTCTRCKNSFEIPDRRAWANSSPGYDTRPCPFCFKVSYIRRHTGKHHEKD